MSAKNQPGMAARLALRAIRAYQRHLSPHKGFVCSYRVHTGRDSCSAYGCRVIARHGLRRGLALLARRLGECGEQHRLHAPRQPEAARRQLPAALHRQAGYCDLPCDGPCDLDLDLGRRAGQAVDRVAGCAVEMAPDCGCDLLEAWRDRRSRRNEERAARRLGSAPPASETE